MTDITDPNNTDPIIRIKPHIYKKYYHHVDTTYIEKISQEPIYHRIPDKILNFLISEGLINMVNLPNQCVLMPSYDLKKLFHLYIKKHNLQKGINIQINNILADILQKNIPLISYKDLNILINSLLKI
jgi:hypothetical protein